MKAYFDAIRQAYPIRRHTCRRLLVSLLFPLCCLCSSGIARCQGAAQVPSPIMNQQQILVNQELSGAIDDYHKLKVGSTLDALLADFSQNGGLSTDTEATFHSKRSDLIQVDVEFTGGGLIGPDFKPHGKPVISKISRLYLEQGVYD